MLEKSPESPLDSKKIKLAILKEINPEESLEVLNTEGEKLKQGE